MTTFFGPSTGPTEVVHYAIDGEPLETYQCSLASCEWGACNGFKLTGATKRITPKCERACETKPQNGPYSNVPIRVKSLWHFGICDFKKPNVEYLEEQIDVKTKNSRLSNWLVNLFSNFRTSLPVLLLSWLPIRRARRACQEVVLWTKRTRLTRLQCQAPTAAPPLPPTPSSPRQSHLPSHSISTWTIPTLPTTLIIHSQATGTFTIKPQT